MAFRATGQLPTDAYSQSKRTAARLKQRVDTFIASSSAGNTSASEVLFLADELRAAKNQLSSAAQVPGIVETARAEEADTEYDPVTEFAALLAEIDSVIAWIAANFPQDADGYVLAFTFNADLSQNYREFTPSMLNGLRAELNKVSSSIT